MNSQKIKSFFRKTGLLPIVEKLRYIFSLFTNSSRNRKFIKEHPGFIPPPSQAAYDAYTTIDHSLYFKSGKKEAEIISAYIDKYASGKNVLDFGCGSARILRHLNSDKYALSGSDYNKQAIEWCKNNFPDINFIHNELTPPVNIESSKFNFIYAISVFTHLSEEVQIKWLNELERISVNGCCIMITLHGERHSSKLLPSELKKFRSGESVVKGKVKEGSRIFTSYHSPKYAKEKLFKGKDIIHFSDQPLHRDFSQDVYIIRVKKS